MLVLRRAAGRSFSHFCRGKKREKKGALSGLALHSRKNKQGIKYRCPFCWRGRSLGIARRWQRAKVASLCWSTTYSFLAFNFVISYYSFFAFFYSSLLPNLTAFVLVFFFRFFLFFLDLAFVA